MTVQPTYEELVEHIRQLEHQHDQDIREIQRLRKLIEIKDSITFNKGMDPRERNLMQGIVARHPDKVLNGEKFEIEVWKERDAVGARKTGSSEMFATLNDLGAIDYTVATKKGDNGKYESKSTIAIDINAIAKVDTINAPKRVEKGEEKKRRRLEAVANPVCPECAAEGEANGKHNIGMVQIACMKHEKFIEGGRQVIDPKKLFREVEEESPISAPTTNVEPTPSTTSTPIEEPDYMADSYADMPVEPDYIRDSYADIPVEPQPQPVTSPQQSLFPDVSKKRAVSATLACKHPLPDRPCLKCGVQDWRWNDVFDTPVCGNCG